MNALTLLETYNSSDSDDVDVDENSDDNKNKTERLPLPAVFHESLNSKVILQERDHNGKVRNFPHERGIWATYVHLQIDPFLELVEYLEDLSCNLDSLHLNAVDDFHVSLTRTVILKHHWIQDFVEMVKKRLSDVEVFRIHLNKLKVYVNEQRTRTFLSLQVDDESGTLLEIVKKLNLCLKEYNLEEFYSDPSFHLSLYWCAGDESERLNGALSEIPFRLKNFACATDITHCVCLSGNKSFKFNFQS